MPDTPSHYDPNATEEERLRYVAAWSADYDRRHPEPRWLVTVEGRNAWGNVFATTTSQEGCTQGEAIDRTRAVYEGMDLGGSPMTITHIQAINMKHVRL